MWRRARARRELHRLEGAKQDLEHLLRLESNRTDAAKVLAEINEELLARTPITPVPLNVLAKLKESPPVIDHASFPHILDLIIAYAPKKSLLLLRATSKSFRQRIDGLTAYGRHLVFTPLLPEAKTSILKEHKHHSLLGRVFTLHPVPESNRTPQLSTNYPLAVDVETGIGTLLANMSVLDICSETNQQSIWQCLRYDCLQTIRLRGVPHRYFDQDVNLYRSRATKIVIFPSLVNNNVDSGTMELRQMLHLPPSARKVVYNIKIQRDSNGVINVAPHCFLLGYTHGDLDIVLVFSDNRGEAFNHTWIYRAFQSVVRSMVGNIVTNALLLGRSRTVTLVNYDDFTAPVIADHLTNGPCSFARHQQILRHLMDQSVGMAIESGLWAQHPQLRVSSVAEAQNKLRFATIEEYRATLQPGEWELETVEE